MKTAQQIPCDTRTVIIRGTQVGNRLIVGVQGLNGFLDRGCIPRRTAQRGFAAQGTLRHGRHRADTDADGWDGTAGDHAEWADGDEVEAVAS